MSNAPIDKLLLALTNCNIAEKHVRISYEDAQAIGELLKALPHIHEVLSLAEPTVRVSNAMLANRMLIAIGVLGGNK